MRKANYIYVTTTIFILMLFINFFPIFNFQQIAYKKLTEKKKEPTFNEDLFNSYGDPILFEGSEDSLVITDTGNLYKQDQQVSVSNQGQTNLNYYLDDVHQWEVSEIHASVRNIQDTREWVSDNDFYTLDTPYQTYFPGNLSNYDPPGNPPHNYSLDLDHNPYNPANIDNTITEPNAVAMRIHFARIEIERDWDILCIYDVNNVLQFVFTGMATDYYTPWIVSDTLKITFNTDGSVQWYGYDIDYYEFYNSTTNYFDFTTSWGYKNESLAGNFGPGTADSTTAMYTTLIGEPFRDGTMGATYYENDYAELYQNITIPRGKVLDAYISFDYYAEYAMDSNENYIYCEINNEKVYSKGLGDIADAGRNIWHSTGNINMDLWLNTTSIFHNIQQNNNYNISVGIMSGASVSYSGFDDRFQQVFWFDNISLVLTTLANSTQTDINLTINGDTIIDNNQWGISSQNFTGTWSTNPIVLTVDTNSPSLEFTLNTTLFGHHNTNSRAGQTSQEGVTYKILENGTIYWEFYHNFYMPAQYSDFEFEISKPDNWDFISALDPTLNSISFEGGGIGDTFLKINKTNAKFPGWWKFKATSPNYIEHSNTKMLKQGQWVEDANFTTGESTSISCQLEFLGEIPKDAGEVNLTVYHPNGTIFFTESKAPVEGNVTFSQILFSSVNTIGGIYEYTLFWSNGTALGGLKSSFIVSHQSSLSLLKPDDAKLDLTTDAFVGDIIPLRVHFEDYENNKDISGAIVCYNWSDGLKYFSDEGLGIYEANLDTSELGSNGFYEILINASKLGFKKDNITLQINLLEETDLLRLDSAYYVEMHDNSTVKYVYTNSTGGGISGASVNININNEYYSITDHFDGNYTIEFDTHYINSLGIYQIEINFSKPSYESQYAIFQFEIIEQSVDISVYINSQLIQENSLIEAMFKGNINVSVRVFAEIDEIYLSGGNMTWNSDNFNKKIIEGGNSWFNDTIPLSSSNFSSGLNSVYIRFEQENYKIKNFGFQILLSEQTVNISTFINGQKINRNTILELTFKEQINISVRVYANSEKIYLSGANITFISNNYYKDLEETIFPWYNSTIDISNSYFISGVNYVYLKFELENYTSDIFSFQFLIKAQKLNLTVLIDSVEISENHLLEFNFNDEFSISALSYAFAEEIYLVNGLMTFVATDYEKNCTGFETYWYNTSILCSSNIFSLGVNYVYLRFQKENYSTTIFSFQILMDQIEINIDPVNFEDSINTEIGETFNISITLLDPKTNAPIERASVSYIWNYGLGELNETTPGAYQAFIDLPENLQGTYRFNLIITPEDPIYKTSQYSFLVIINEPIVDEPNFPNYLLWIIIGVLISIVSALGILSLRTYVYMPKKRRREAELLSKTQRFKDLKNIQAIVVIHKLSGIPIYSRSYSILERHKKELFSGFIQAITMVGEEFAEKEVEQPGTTDKEEVYGVEKIMELDFKQFYCLIADIEDLRTVFILKERSSERMKSQISHLILALNLKLSEQLGNWDGSLDQFEVLVPEILNEYFELYYKDSFKLASDINLIALKKERNLTKMEMRIINVIQSMSQDNIVSNLNNIVDLVHEENKNLIIEAIESLIKRKIILPLNN